MNLKKDTRICIAVAFGVLASVVASMPTALGSGVLCGGHPAPAVSFEKIEGAFDPNPHNTFKWNNWKCIDFPSSCPPGPQREENGNYTGCNTSGPGGCGGQCVWCPGAQNPGHFCQISIGDKCTFSPQNTKTACGIKHLGECVPVEVVPPGELAPPNGCVCVNPASTREKCRVNMCTE